jgi:acetate kinase
LNILALNSGSSSIKFASYGAGASALEELLRGDVETRGADDAASAIGEIARRLADAGLPTPDAIGHRIVHGGPKLLRHCRIDAPVLRELERAATFAPLHGPAALAVLSLAKEKFPRAAQVSCFDTAFHAQMPEVARTLPLPKGLRSEGIHRYGFHGLSCESIVHQLAGELPQRLVIAHLGNGCSVTAVKSGASIDTSMGLTPTGGVIMGTRTGDLDPGALVYLLREKKLDASALEDLVDRRSGLLGISGLSSDMRRLREVASSNADARLAVEMFRYSVRKQVGAMAAALGGMDLLVFTGGIGENDAQAREAICEGLGWRVRVIATREEERIAFHVRTLLAA